MSHETVNQQVCYSKIARACGLKVLIGLPVTVGLLALVGKTIENGPAVLATIASLWAALLWTFSLGGHFWGAASIGVIALAVLAWGCCVLIKLPENVANKERNRVSFIGLGALFCFLLAQFSLNATYTDFDALSIYGVLAVLVMGAPFVIIGVGVVLGILMVVTEAASQVE